jgi:2,5-furandicarboxylate decarboxylase 1
MPKDLRSFIRQLTEEHPSQLLHVKRQIAPATFDATAILEQLQRRGRRPMVLFEDTLDIEGRASGIPVAMNVFADRARCAIALDLPPDEVGIELSLEYSRRGQRDPLPPVVVAPADAPVKQVVHTGDAIDTRRLPIPSHSEGDYGPCLTMTLAVKDPETVAYNAAFIKAFYDFEDQRRLRITIHSPDTERALAYYESRDEPMPIVAIMGHHPAFYLGTMGLTPYQSDDYTTIGAFLGEPLRLVPSETWGEDFLVPADAELVIEGVVPPGVRRIADPFGDITRQYQAQTLRPVMEITAITQRQDAILQDVFAGHHDHFTVGQIPKEGTVYNNLRKRFGDVIKAVHLPYSGCGRLACYVSIDKTKEGQAKSVALAAVQESWTFQVVVVVDAVIDVFDESDVIWSVLVNVDPTRDVDVLHNIPNVFTTQMSGRKILVDATRPLDRAIPDMNRVPAEAIERIRLQDDVEGIF